MTNHIQNAHPKVDVIVGTVRLILFPVYKKVEEQAFHVPETNTKKALIVSLVGLDARGFLFGPGIALNLGIGFVPIRKQGKLPGETISVKSEKEYGKVSGDKDCRQSYFCLKLVLE